MLLYRKIMAMSSIGVFKTLGMTSLAYASAVQVDPELVDEVNQTPVTIASLFLVGVTVYMAFRAWTKSSEALMTLAKELSEKPCIRSPKND